MNKNSLSAAIKIMTGAFKIFIARQTGNKRLENEGRIERASGKFQNIAAKGMDALRKR